MKKPEISQRTLQKEFKQALESATTIQGIVKKEWFTANEFVKKSNAGHTQAKGILNYLMKYGVLKTESKQGKFRHKILFTPKERLEAIQQTVDILKNDIKLRQESILFLSYLRTENQITNEPPRDKRQKNT